MKKYISLLLAILVLGCNVAVAKAATLQQGQSVTITHTGSKNYTDNDTVAGGSTIHLYKMTSPYSLNAYCEDANLKGPSNGRKGYTITRILDPKTDYRDAGLIEILKADSQIPTNIAIRAFNIATGRSAGGSEFPFTTSAYYNLTKELCSGISECGSISNPYGNNATINFSASEKSSAKALLESGLKAAAAAKEAKDEETEKEGVIVAGPTFTEEDGKNMAIYVFTFPEVEPDENGVINYPVRNLRLETNASGIGPLQYRDGSGTWKNIPSDEALYEAAKNNSFKLEIGFTYELDTTSEECQPIDYAIKYEGQGEMRDFIAAEATAASSQRFLVILKNGDANKDDAGETQTIEGTIECGAEACDTIIETPICSDDTDVSTVSITAPKDVKKCILNNHDDSADPGNSYQLSTDNGGVDNDYCQIFCKEDYAEITLNSHIEDVKCLGTFSLSAKIVGSKDCYVSSNSKYPSHPGERNFEKSININKYLKDIEASQKSMVRILNKIKEYEAKLEGAKSSIKEVKNFDYCGGDVCGKQTVITVKWADYLQYSFEFIKENGRFWDDGKNYRGEKVFKDECNETCYSYTAADGSEQRKCGGDACKPTAEKEFNAWVKELQDGLDSAKQALPKELLNYENIIRDFNTCTGKITNSVAGDDITSKDWLSRYEFAQKLEWYYSEARYNNSPTPSYDDTYFNLVAGKNYFTPTQGKVYRDTELNRDGIQFCKTDVGNEYNECGWIGSIDGVTEQRTYVYCDENDCYEDDENISQATFIKLHFGGEKYEETYEVPTVFYQSYPDGRVANKDGADSAETISPIVGKIESKIEFTPLENELAVSASLVGGGLFKLKIQDLGEFYDLTQGRNANDRYGRLLDFEGDNQANSVGANNGANNESGGSGVTVHWNGEYICHYYSPCQPPDCPTCEFECETAGKCEWCVGEDCCPECEFKCKEQACLINLGELKASGKTISTTAIASQTGCTTCKGNGASGTGTAEAFREFGYNWNINTDIKAFELVKAKAQKTIEEIADANTTVYDERKADDSSLNFSITLTSKMINDIREYNEAAQDAGSYKNNSLTCYDYNTGGKTYEKVFCYSNVIDAWVKEYGDDIYIKNRDNGARTEDSVNNNINKNADSTGPNYWTPWNDLKLVDATKECESKKFDVSGNTSCEIYYGGPSWR